MSSLEIQTGCLYANIKETNITKHKFKKCKYCKKEFSYIYRGRFKNKGYLSSYGCLNNG